MRATDRLQCLVPGCHRTRGQRKGEPPVRKDEEWICGDHWRAVPIHMRQRKSRLARRYRRAFGDTQPWSYSAGSRERLQAVKLSRLCGTAWDLCKRAAIERALGI